MKFPVFRIFLILLIMLSLGAEAQPGKVFTSTKSRKAFQLYEQSTEYLLRRDYGNAELLLIKATEIDPEYIDALMRLSSIYYRQKKIELEKMMYEKVIAIEPNYPNVYYNYGAVLMRMQKYEQAIEQFRLFKDFGVVSENFYRKASTNIRLCSFRDSCIKHPTAFNPVKVGEGVNSYFDEYWPCLTADYETFYFTRMLESNPQASNPMYRYNEDIYVSKYVNDAWSTAVPMPGNINTPNMNEGAIAISPDGKYLLYTICVEGYDYIYGACDIFIAEYKNGEWQKGINIGPPINTQNKETQPSISFDGKTLYFSSKRPGGYGGLDIWKSIKQEDGSWGEPINLGPNINTKLSEEAPFIHPDNKTLYFSTKGGIGMGEGDIFMSRLGEDGVWGKGINLGYPINTEDSEFSLFVSSFGNIAFIASRRDTVTGSLDLYSFEMPEHLRPDPVAYVKGIIYDKYSKQKLDAVYSVLDIETGEVVYESVSDAKTGAYLTALPADRNYVINVSRKGYMFFSDALPIKGLKSSAFIKDVPLNPIKVGEKIVLNNVFFEFDKSTIKKESEVELAILIKFLNDYPSLKIEIGGHTDNKGADSYNLNLSNERAKAVYDYLISKGVDASRLAYKGYGETQAIESNNTEEGRAKNRRTEFKIIAK
jgi:outer membrane protein OmpA-like peptidoglycan-associated protein/tetratricopeptide (TPR) repeat protein